MSDDDSIITSSETIPYFANGGEFNSSGYLINSLFNNKNLPPILTINKEKSTIKDDRFTSKLRGLAVPLGLTTLLKSPFEDNKSSIDLKKMDGGKQDHIIDDSLYNRLLSLVEEHKKEKKSHKTKKHNNLNKKQSKKSKKTRKHN